MKIMPFRTSFLLTAFTVGFVFSGSAALVIDPSIPQFSSLVQKELTEMREGKRGVACQELVKRLDTASVSTTISPLTADERTWHPNDRKGTRSHVVSLDTKVRGSSRTIPTATIIYLHPSRIDPSLSLFKLGTFAQLLAVAADMNRGTYSGDFRVQEKRSVFFRNSWRDSKGLELISISDRVPTLDYQGAKKAGLIVLEHASEFPILNGGEIK